eukprot:scaffold760_cov372-Prasinococcus_capsulatus_cf.AAC.6
MPPAARRWTGMLCLGVAQGGRAVLHVCLLHHYGSMRDPDGDVPYGRALHHGSAMRLRLDQWTPPCTTYGAGDPKVPLHARTHLEPALHPRRKGHVASLRGANTLTPRPKLLALRDQCEGVPASS